MVFVSSFFLNVSDNDCQSDIFFSLVHCGGAEVCFTNKKQGEDENAKNTSRLKRLK